MYMNIGTANMNIWTEQPPCNHSHFVSHIPFSNPLPMNIIKQFASSKFNGWFIIKYLLNKLDYYIFLVGLYNILLKRKKHNRPG